MSASLNELVAAQSEWTVVQSVATNAVCTATKAAVAGKVHYITGVTLSVSAAPAATVSVTLTDGATTVDRYELPAAAMAPVSVNYVAPVKCSVNSAAAVSIPAVGGTTRATAVIRGFTRNA